MKREKGVVIFMAVFNKSVLYEGGGGEADVSSLLCHCWAAWKKRCANLLSSPERVRDNPPSDT